MSFNPQSTAERKCCAAGSNGHGSGDVNHKGIIYAVFLPYVVTARLELPSKLLILLALPTDKK